MCIRRQAKMHTKEGSSYFYQKMRWKFERKRHRNNKKSGWHHIVWTLCPNLFVLWGDVLINSAFCFVFLLSNRPHWWGGTSCVLDSWMTVSLSSGSLGEIPMPQIIMTSPQFCRGDGLSYLVLDEKSHLYCHSLHLVPSCFSILHFWFLFSVTVQKSKPPIFKPINPVMVTFGLHWY